MATKQSILFLLVVLFFAFSLVLAGEKQQEKNANSINGVNLTNYNPSIEITGAAGKVDQFGRGFFGGGRGGLGGGRGGLGGGRGGQPRRCFRCGWCCRFRCCTEEELKEYIKTQGVLHN